MDMNEFARRFTAAKDKLYRIALLYLGNEEFPESAAEEFDSLPLKDAISRLPKELKEIVVLRYFSGYTLKETAEILDIPQGTAATRQRRALSLLRLELGEEVQR